MTNPSKSHQDSKMVVSASSSSLRLKDCCLVEMSTLPGTRGKKGKLEASCSGILISQKHGLVITQGTILLPALSVAPENAEKLFKSGTLDGGDFNDLRVTVSLEQVAENRAGENESSHGKYSTALLNVTSGNMISSGKTEKWAGEVSVVWKVPEFESHLKKLFPRSDGWKFVDESLAKESTDKDKSQESNKTKQKESDSEKVGALLPYFVLLKLHNWRPRSRQLSVVPARTLRVGQSVFAVGTPFGNLSPPVFMNSVSKGIVCNLAGHQNEVVLTDARCIPGSEGGAVFCGESPDRLQLAAMIVAPLCWKANEWIGLSICCSLSSVLESLAGVDRAIIGSVAGQTHTETIRSASLTPDLTPAPQILFIRNGGSWGTGVLISDRHSLVLTCSHVVKLAKSVRTRDDEGMWHDAEVIYATPQGRVFDLALLKLEGREPCGSSVADLVDITQDFQEGDTVRMIGHAVFERIQQMAPSVTQGIISRVVSAGPHAVLLQSCSAVHGGASGGPLVADDGTLISLVTCNARDTKSGASYPHVNMSVPLRTVWPVIQKYIATQDASVLDQLHIQNSSVERLWELQLKDVGSPTRSQL